MAKDESKETMAIVALLLNVLVLPGVGSLVGGKTKEGVWQLVLFVGGLFIGFLFTITLVGAIIGIPLMFGGPLAAWIWSIFTGVSLIKEADASKSKKTKKK